MVMIFSNRLRKYVLQERSKSLIQRAFFASLEAKAAKDELDILMERMGHFKTEYERKLVGLFSANSKLFIF